MTGQLHKVVDIAEVSSNRKRGGDVRVLLGPATVGAASGFQGVVLLEPGEQVREHYHPYSEEFLFLFEGEVEVDLDGVAHALRPHQAVFVPIDVRHRVRNTGPRLARLVFHLSPLAPRPELGHVDTEPSS
ncbi:putative monooxygenase [Saccharopolyspora kobensis]|uniref:Monooxygenase n=1 Tax=Saccharopolyspora kobensis TaxID=146035 RepID=A0A1H5UYZ6_9PSEU|nr:cupin domain-containing protein [Saccharopolyspora kobensis]SEF80382.1 putative monooxygenase [Saccharopolyspora kobensis]SFC67247.1 putative monooxygenase [Saccharopolyspora kobensis]